MRRLIVLVALLCVGCDCCDDEDDDSPRQIAASHSCGSSGGGHVPVPTDFRSPVAVIYDGWQGGSCANDLVCTGAPDVFLGDVQLSGDCPSREFVALAPRQGAESGSWLPTHPLFLGKQPTGIGLSFWLVATPERMVEVESTAVANALDAMGIYNRFGTGLTLQFRTPGSQSDRGDFHRVSGEAEQKKIGTTCYGSDAIVKEDGRRVYDAGRINMYFVPLYFSGHDGLDCWRQGHRDIIFISYDFGGSAAKLAHELGHALGLMRPQDAWGHVNDLAGFPGKYSNLMYGGVQDVGGITLGQIYRLNFDSTAWMHRAGKAEGRMYRTCQDDAFLSAPCPPLALSTPGRWP